MLTPEEQKELLRLVQEHIPIRAIARRLGRDVKTIRRAMRAFPRSPRPERPQPSRLEPFHDLIRAKFALGLRSPRILREIRERGYTGARTILKDFLQSLGPRQSPRKKAFTRFETGPGVEAQSDWSPYRVIMAGQETVVHAFSMILCHSRRSFVDFFRNERLPTLLWAHQEAFRYHQGVCSRIAYDNQTAITLGRVGGKPLWNPPFLDFAAHYAFTPLVGRPRAKERRGKVERPFHFLEEDFLRGRHFDSWDDLRTAARHWLDTVANVRWHETLKRWVNEVYAEERPCLIALPEVAYPAARQEIRKVQKDGYIPVDGSYFPVPDNLVGQSVAVRIDPERIEVLGPRGQVVASYRVPAQPMRLPAPAPPPGQPGSGLSRTETEARFLARFPGAAQFLDHLKRRMTALTPIHLHLIERLAVLYGAERVRDALATAAAYANYNARAVERILQRAHPTVVPEPDPGASAPRPEAFGALDDVDPGSPSDYTFDSSAPTGGPDNDP